MREVLLRPAYRGEAVYGKTAKAYGRELGPQRGAREKGQIPVPEETWIRHEVLAIVDPEHAWRVGQAVASQTVPSWNQIAGFLDSMRRLPGFAGLRSMTTPLSAPIALSETLPIPIGTIGSCPLISVSEIENGHDTRRPT